jgi:hypothetical protein
MPDKIITIEDLKGPLKDSLEEMMSVVPRDQRKDKNLQRLIAFRLKLDGEDMTKDYLIRHIEFARQCGYNGSLFDFLKDDHEENLFRFRRPDPPDEIG